MSLSKTGLALANSLYDSVITSPRPRVKAIWKKNPPGVPGRIPLVLAKVILIIAKALFGLAKALLGLAEILLGIT